MSGDCCLGNKDIVMCQRCFWATGVTELETVYHDQEWGRPQKDDRVLFEFLILEAAQAGLSWRTVLEKREGYRRHYFDFDPEKVARISTETAEAMLLDPAIIRNRRKVESSIENARIFLQIQQEHGSFAQFIWQFVDYQPRQNHVTDYRDIPAETEQSKAMSKTLKKLGMRFVGPTICYAFMQAVGMVNDHETSCTAFSACSAAGAQFSLD
jgi:DNA-3-methyladenine glycosylase I